MKTQQPIASDDEHRVLQFRPRTPAFPPVQRSGMGKLVQLEEALPEPNELSLSRYERPRDEPDDFRHRMLANIAAVAFTVALMAIGIWLAKSIADLRNTQDCGLTGRHDCARIDVPHP